MREQIKELFRDVKKRVEDESKEMSREEREEFFDKLNEWSYEHYEDALLEGEAEMQNYDED